MKIADKEKSKGITLIALIVTIIVLLILAGVALSSLTGDNGIMTKAIKSSFYTEMQAINEQKETNNIYKDIYKYVDKVQNPNATLDVNSNKFISTQLTVEELNNLSGTLKAEIYYLSSSAFSKGQKKSTEKIWKKYENELKNYDNNSSAFDLNNGSATSTSCNLYGMYGNETNLEFTCNNRLYYISEEVTGKEKAYIYDYTTDKCFKIADTKIDRCNST